MGLVVDLILVLIIGLNVFIGYKKGLIKVAFNILAFVIALIASVVLFKPVSCLIINNTQIDENVKEIIIKNNLFKENEQSSDEEENKQQKEDGKNNFIQKYIQDTITEKTNEAKNKALETTASVISIKFVEIITAIALFILVRVAIILLRFLTDTISKLPIIKQFNEAGGIIYGLLKSIIIILITLTIIFIITSIKGSSVVSDSIDDSYITKYLYNNNIIVKYCFLNKNLL